MELLGLILGILAFLLAIWHERELRFQVHELNNIRGSLSTRYIGKFPSYLSDIVQRIENAKTSICILCDFPAYGNFSDPANFIRYRHAIERKILEGVEVKIICFNDAKRVTGFEKQFGSYQDWNGWKGKHKEKVRSFLNSRRDLNYNVDDLSLNELLSVIRKNNQQVLEESFGAAVKKEVDTDIPVFLWIVDDEYAIFAIPGYPTNEISFGEYGFLTLDQMLIRAFKDMQRRY